MKLRLSILLMLLPAFAMAGGFPEESPVLPGCDRQSVEQRLLSQRIDSLEGIWYYPEERLTVAVERLANGSKLPEYSVAVVDADDMSIACGTVAGYLQATAEPRKLRLWLYSVNDGGKLRNPVECVAEMTRNGMISIHRTKLKMRVSANLSRFLPSVFGGIRIYPHVETETINPGMRRIWPADERVQYVIF